MISANVNVRIIGTIKQQSATASTSKQHTLSVADVREQLVNDYLVHELPKSVDDASKSSSLPTDGFQSCSLQTEPLFNAALLARIEYLEAENTSRNECPPTEIHFRIEQVKHDDHLQCS